MPSNVAGYPPDKIEITLVGPRIQVEELLVKIRTHLEKLEWCEQ